MEGSTVLCRPQADNIAYTPKISLIAPMINIEDNPAYDIFSLFKAEIPIKENLFIFTSIQSLNLLNKDGNIKCGQDLRLGVDINGYKFGLAAGFEQSSPHFAKSTNFGVFIQKEEKFNNPVLTHGI